MITGIIDYTIQSGDQVTYIDSEGKRNREQVIHVWKGLSPPLVNLSNDQTSVPHISHVNGATGNYYLLEI